MNGMGRIKMIFVWILIYGQVIYSIAVAPFVLLCWWWRRHQDENSFDFGFP